MSDNTPVAPISIPPLSYGGFSKKPTPLEKDDNMVIAPHDHDVLCGRGGLTNHHPGNTWYRRLVRSNRNLYKISPKHTKLLVSKAIVHHVQSQNPPGRFLECHKTTGLWLPVPYKRAVDKTSQALRERDRDDEEDGEEDPPIQTISSGMPPNLSDLAQAAMTHSRMAHPAMVLPPHPSSKMNNAASAKSAISAAEEPVPPPPGGKRPLERGTSWFGFGGAKKAKTEEDPIPLPTAPLQQRSSSIFRFFQTSGLFGGGQQQHHHHQQQAPAPAVNDFHQQQSGGFQDFQAGTNRQMHPSFSSSLPSQSAGPLSFNNSALHGSHMDPNFRPNVVSSGAPLYNPGTSTGSDLAPTFGQTTSSGSHNVASNLIQGSSSSGSQMAISNFGQVRSTQTNFPHFGRVTSIGSQVAATKFGQESTIGSQMTDPTFSQAMSGGSAHGASNFGQSSSTGLPQGFNQQGSSQAMLPNFNNGHNNSGFNQGNTFSLHGQQASLGYNNAAVMQQPSTLFGTQQHQLSSQSINNWSQQGRQQLEMLQEQQQQFNHLQQGNNVAPPPPLPVNDISAFGEAPEFEPRPLDGAGDFKQQGTEAPSLTRLTTQVSDWLTSFWPLHRQLSSEVSQQHMQQQQMQQQHMQQQRQLQQIDTNPMNQQIPHGNLNLQQRGALQQLQHEQQGGMPGMSQQQQQYLTQQQQIHQQIPNTSGVPPPELNQSVSSMFLKLATTPSRLFSGLSTVFDRSQSSLTSNVNQGVRMNAGNSMINFGISSNNTASQLSNNDMGNQGISSNNNLTSHGMSNTNMGNNLGNMSSSNMGNQAMLNGSLGSQEMTMGINPGVAPEMGTGPPSLGRAAIGNKSTLSRSLLDDYEETAMEKRLRTVTSR